MKAIILAAGKGTRLSPLTDHISKAMMPIANVPITERLILQIHRETGITGFIIVASGPDQDLVEYLSSNKTADRFGADLEFRFVYQGEQRGMGDALKLVLDDVQLDGPFLVAACDCLYARGEIAGFLELFADSEHDACLAVLKIPMEDMSSASTVRIENGLIRDIIEKPSPREVLSPYGSVPMYILKPGVKRYLDQLKPSRRGEYEIQDAFRAWIRDSGRFAAAFFTHRQTVTTIADLVRLNIEYISSEPLLEDDSLDSAVIIEPVLMAEEAEFGSGSVIGPNAVIGRGVKIGNGCRVRDAVVTAASVVPADRLVEGGCWHGEEFFPA